MKLKEKDVKWNGGEMSWIPIYEVGVQNAYIPLHYQVLMYGDLNFEYKVDIFFAENTQNKSDPCREPRYQALG